MDDAIFYYAFYLSRALLVFFFSRSFSSSSSVLLLRGERCARALDLTERERENLTHARECDRKKSSSFNSLFKNDIRGSITLLPRVIMITLFSLSLRAADQREEEEEEEDVCCVSRSALSREL